ncbi:hypothetical protein [Thiocystis violacea]|uniref:hypothetical protein n=1 Tax=Thiocystis violacea TaxID=13725 RepID=UPI0019039FDC|nr:hypothetical protein [Thiocystis violacea]MBK1722108.1 hypothetical protein [Thiocystis violacea]
MMRALPVMVVLALLLVLLLQWLGWPPSLSPPDAAQETAVPVATDQTPAPGAELLRRLELADPKDAYASVIEHPLFRPDRKPEPPQEADAEVSAAPEDNQELDAIDLSAVLISPTVVSAWVKDPSKPKLQRLRIGDDFMGWSVREILEDRIRLERQGEQDELILRDYSKAAPSVAPPSAASRTPARQRPPRAPRPPMPAIPPRK